ncbi:profilin [Streptomyces sp. NPDC058655]|uniref:profilin n=1 Tax=Streptomyces sp. NPDC058655 TaxID=3346577 RepID=UPI003650941E
MSDDWQSFVDEQLVGTGQVRQAAIIGLDGLTRAQSPGWQLRAGEGANIVALFNRPDQVSDMGIVVNGVRYKGTKGDDHSIHGTKGTTGVALVKTKQHIVIGYHEHQSPDLAANVVEKFADYLVENGY